MHIYSEDEIVTCIYIVTQIFLYRYLVWLEVFLTNIDKTHPRAKELLKRGGIAVARSLIPGALSAVDKTMEETFMKFAKSSGIVQYVYAIMSGEHQHTELNGS